MSKPTPQKLTCPQCRQSEGVQLIYGLPSEELLEGADREEIVLGGCVLYGDMNMPNTACTSCGHQWSSEQ